MKVKIKRTHPKAMIPCYAKSGDACLDLFAVSKDADDHGNAVFDTGIAVEIPPGYVGLVFPRSSISKTMHSLRNSVGVIDSGYRGSIILKFWGGRGENHSYKIGDRIGQIMIIPHPKVEFCEVEELTSSYRGADGFGSTGE